nr:SGNH/GDSL hydrolase family protein [Gordonia jinghuaiqii]
MRVHAPEPQQDSQAWQVPASQSAPTLLIIGDSFAGGTGNPEFDAYPAVLMQRTGWHVRVDAQGGTGFVNPGVKKTVRLIDRLESDRRIHRPDYILVDAGRNDLDMDPTRVSAAIDDYFDRMKTAFPQAKTVIILPSYLTSEPPSNYGPLRDALTSSAEKIEAKVIDPVAEEWYVGIDLNPLLGPDGVHLNGPGNQFYANKIIDRLRAFGFPVGSGEGH